MQSQPLSTPCPLCGSLDDHIEIENAQSSDQASQEFPLAYSHLCIPNADLEALYEYRDERLLVCPTCGTYFGYRRWAPGGSEDVLHTWIHESLTRLTPFATDQNLREALAEIRRRDQDYPSGVWRRQRAAAESGVAAELALLKGRPAQVIPDAIAAVESCRADTPEGLAAYRAAVLAEYLAVWAKDPTPTPTWLCRSLALLNHDQPAVRDTLWTALSDTLRVGAERATLARELLRSFADIPPVSAEAIAIREACAAIAH